MKRISEFIVNKRKIICFIFAVLVVAGAVLWFFVRINYDLSAYLPKNSETIEGMEISNGEFGENGALTAMISDVSLSEARAIKKQVAAVENVQNVLWLDDILLEYKDALGQMVAAAGQAGLVPDELMQAFASDGAFLDFVFAVLEDPSSLPPSVQQLLPMFGQALEPLQAAVDQFYKDNKALYQITFTGTAYDNTTLAAIKEIKKIKPINMAGPSATSYAMQSVIITEITTALIIVVPLLLLILFAATSSFFDPVVFIAVIAVSVVVNMGSNIILGSVSYLTNSIAILLQVAVSMDYSIFFLHAYKKERKNGRTAAESAKAAVRSAFRPISASSLTTVASFAAMLFMRYTIGFDMGLVLGKGIIISLLTVFLFMPGFVVMTDKAITKGEHRSLLSLFSRRGKTAPETAERSAAPAAEQSPAETGGTIVSENIKAAEKKKQDAPIDNLNVKSAEKPSSVAKPPFRERFAGGVIKARFVVPILFLLLIVPAYFGQSNNNFMYGELATAGGKGSLLETDRTAVETTFGSQNNAVILFDRELYDGGKELELTVKLLGLRLDGSEKEYIVSAQSYSFLSYQAEQAGMQGAVPDYMTKQLVGKGNYNRIILIVDTEEESDEAFAVATEIRRIVAETLTGGGYYLMGGTLSTQELQTINKSDYNLVTLLTLAFIMLILLITFRGLVLPVILGVVITSAIWIGMSIPYLLAEPLVFLGYLIVSCVQMGATIDYGILLSSHYTEHRKNMGKLDAGKAAFLSSTGPVTLSASILAMVGFTISFTGLTAVSSGLGLLVGRGTVISYLLMIFVLPMLLVIFDKPIKFTTLKLKRKNKTAPEKPLEKPMPEEVIN